MKKSLQFCLMLFSLIFLLKNQMLAQTAVVTINYGVFTNQCCSANTIPYYCFNDPVSCGAPCGCNTATNSQNFTNPIPAGNIVTQVDISYFALNCGGSVSATINGSSVGSSPIINGSCLCSSLGSGATGNSTGNFPCGLAGYNNAAGAIETFVSTFTGEVCIATAQLTLHYAPASQAVPASQPGAISGLTAVCAGSSNNYSIPAVGNATGYTWSVPAGWAINSGQGTTSINVTAGASGGSVCVDASNLCGTSAQTCLPVSIATAPATPGAPSGTTTMCSGTSVVYNTSGSAGATSYNWTVPAGAVINSGQGTTSINVTMGASSGNVCVTASNACGTSAPACTAITIGGVQPTPGSPSGTTSVCGGSSQVYTTTGSAGATTYNWTVPAGAAINSGQGTTSINVTMGASSGNVCVTATGPCGTSAAACTPITITSVPVTPGSITGPSPVCIGSDNYIISAVGGATSYSWSVSGGGTVTGGQGTTAGTINWTSAGSFIVFVSASNACGASTQATLPVTVNANPVISITPSSASICSGSIATMTASGGATYTWTPDASITSGLGGAAISADPTSTDTYTVTGTNGNGCMGTATQVITVNPSPTVTLSGGGANSQTVCAGGTVTGISFVVTPAGTVNWTCTNAAAIGMSPSGSGNIGSYTAPSVVTPQTGVITANATASGTGCPSTGSTNLTYTIGIIPLPGLTTVTTTSAGCGLSNGTATVTGTGGSGSYLYNWNSTGFGASTSYTAAAGTYPVSVEDAVTGCTFTENFTIPNAGAPPAPTVTLSATSACVGGSVVLSAPVVAGTTYSWTESGGPTGTGNTYTVNNIPASPSTYSVSVTATSSGCTSAAATATIAVNQPPNAVISTSSGGAICAGSCTTLSVSPTGANITYQWGNSSGSLAGDIADTLRVCSAGSYTVLVTNTVTTCSAVASANGTIAVNPLPTIDTAGLTNTQSSCTAPTGSITNVTISAGTPAYSYTWTSGTSTGSSAGTGTGTPASLLNVSAGAYCLNVTDANGCAASFCSVNVTDIGAPPTPTLSLAGNDTTYCQGQTLNPLVVSVTSGTATPTVNWYNNPSGSGIALATGTNTYTPTGLSLGTNTIYAIAESAGCSSIALPISITINPLPGPPVLSAGLTNPVNECSGTIPAPTISVTASGTVVATPVWYNSSGQHIATGTTYTPSTSVVGTSVYTIIDSVATSGGCTSAAAGAVLSLTVTINQSPLPPTLVNVTNPITECQGQTPAVTATVTPAAGTTPVWYNSSGSAVAINTLTYIPSNAIAGNFVYTVIDSSLTNGCTSAATGSVLPVGVIVNSAPTTPTITTAATTFTNCQGIANTPITVNSGTAIPVWFNSAGQFIFAGNPFIPPGTIGTNTYTVMDSSSTNACFSLSGANSETVVVTVYPTPTVNISSATIDSANCGKAGGVNGLVASDITGGTPGYHYQWLNGGTVVSTSLNFTTTTGGSYSLEVTDTNGCHALTTGGINPFNIPSVISPTVAFTTSPNPATGNIPLAVTFTNQTIGTTTSYVWVFGDGNSSSNTVSPTNTYTAVGTYTVMLIAVNGSCRDTAKTIVITDEPTTIIIPNVFSPNGDNINDLFFIINTGMSSLNCNIFNRWGQLLYTITAPDQSWDGKTPNGDNAPDGTYMYILQAQGLNGKTYKQQGTVTLIR